MVINVLAVLVHSLVLLGEGRLHSWICSNRQGSPVKMIKQGNKVLPSKGSRPSFVYYGLTVLTQYIGIFGL